MFKRDDYWPYMIGVFLFAGFAVIPLIYGMILDAPYERVLVGSLIGCGIFAFAHTRNGDFSFMRLIGGMVIVFFITLKIAAKSGGAPVIGVPGGMLGFLVMSACGWAGIGIGRLFRSESGKSVQVITEPQSTTVTSEIPDTPAVRMVEESPHTNSVTWMCDCGEVNLRLADECRICGATKGSLIHA